MGWLLPALTARKFETQRDVVLNERRQNYENRPYGLAGMAIAAALFAPDHPYHWPTIGVADDVRNAQLGDVHAFFARFYHPGNASLVLAGDIGAAEGFDLAERYFGDVPRGPDVAPPRPARPVLGATRRVLIEDKVEFPRLYLAWHSPAMFERGDAELDFASDFLANAKTSRLYRSLVFERRVALDVSAFQTSREIAGMFQVVATAAPGASLQELEAAITAEIGRIAADGPTGDELERARAQVEALFVSRLQTVGGFNGKSDQLNAYNTFLREPGYFERDLQRYLQTSAESIRSAVAAVLTRPRVELSIVPRGRTDLALPGSEPSGVS
jgi:zinc protease